MQSMFIILRSTHANLLVLRPSACVPCTRWVLGSEVPSKLLSGPGVTSSLAAEMCQIFLDHVDILLALLSTKYTQ